MQHHRRRKQAHTKAGEEDQWVVMIVAITINSFLIVKVDITVVRKDLKVMLFPVDLKLEVNTQDFHQKVLCKEKK